MVLILIAIIVVVVLTVVLLCVSENLSSDLASTLLSFFGVLLGAVTAICRCNLLLYGVGGDSGIA
jgi:hypothetical protein